MDKILKVKDIQNHLGISKTRAYEIIRLKNFPKIKIGHRYYVLETEYEEWLKNNLKNRILL